MFERQAEERKLPSYRHWTDKENLPKGRVSRRASRGVRISTHDSLGWASSGSTRRSTARRYAGGMGAVGEVTRLVESAERGAPDFQRR